MVKKIKKYLKFVVCCALILSLIAPSYAALSASDGSAFVTKAEFDAALADFNARLTTFEAGINSKIDSQVTSYLDRNGIWNGAEQKFIFLENARAHDLINNSTNANGWYIKAPTNGKISFNGYRDYMNEPEGTTHWESWTTETYLRWFEDFAFQQVQTSGYYDKEFEIDKAITWNDDTTTTYSQNTLYQVRSDTATSRDNVNSYTSTMRIFFKDDIVKASKSGLMFLNLDIQQISIGNYEKRSAAQNIGSSAAFHYAVRGVTHKDARTLAPGSTPEFMWSLTYTPMMFLFLYDQSQKRELIGSVRDDGLFIHRNLSGGSSEWVPNWATYVTPWIAPGSNCPSLSVTAFVEKDKTYGIALKNFWNWSQNDFPWSYDTSDMSFDTGIMYIIGPYTNAKAGLPANCYIY